MFQVKGFLTDGDYKFIFDINEPTADNNDTLLYSSDMIFYKNYMYRAVTSDTVVSPRVELPEEPTIVNLKDDITSLFNYAVVSDNKTTFMNITNVCP